MLLPRLDREGGTCISVHRHRNAALDIFVPGLACLFKDFSLVLEIPSFGSFVLLFLVVVRLIVADFHSNQAPISHSVSATPFSESFFRIAPSTDNFLKLILQVQAQWHT